MLYLCRELGSQTKQRGQELFFVFLELSTLYSVSLGGRDLTSQFTSTSPASPRVASEFWGAVGSRNSLCPSTRVDGFPKCCSGIESACQCRRHRRQGFDPWVRKITWRRKWQRTPVFLPGKSHGPRRQAGYSPCGRKEFSTTEAI